MHQPRKIDKRSDLRFVFSFWLWPLLLGLWCISSRHLALKGTCGCTDHNIIRLFKHLQMKVQFLHKSKCLYIGWKFTVDSVSMSVFCCSLWLYSKSMQKYAKWSKWICPQNVCLLKLKCVLLVAEGLSISGTCWWAGIAVPLVHMLHPWKNWGMLEHPDPRQRHGSYQKAHWPFDDIWCKIPTDLWIVNNIQWIQLLTDWPYHFADFNPAHRIVPVFFFAENPRTAPTAFGPPCRACWSNWVSLPLVTCQRVITGFGGTSSTEFWRLVSG